MAQTLQELVMSFKSLKSRQVKELKDDNALKVYRELHNGELNWTTVMEDKGPNSIPTEYKQDEEIIQDLSKRTAMLKWHRTLGVVLPDHVHSNQTQPPTERTLTPPDVCTPGSAEATFVSDISNDVTLGSEIIKANTTLCSATKLVISLTTTALVSAFAVDAILKAGADQLFDTEANMLPGRVKVLHRGVEMSMNGSVYTYMSGSKRQRQVANDIVVNATDRIQTILTIPQLNFLKNNVGTAHPIQHRFHPITALESKGFFRNGRRSKDFSFSALAKTERQSSARGWCQLQMQTSKMHLTMHTSSRIWLP